jgi:F-type H+-transporting ATPase subunit delta
MKHYTLVKRYVDAFVGTVKDSPELDEIIEQFKELDKLFDDNLTKFFSSPTISDIERKQLVDKVFKQQGFHEKLVRFIDLLVDKRRVGLIHEIVELFIDEINALKGLKQVEVFVKYPLTDTNLNKIKEILHNHYKKEILIKEKIASNLIGGLMIKMGNQTLDLSVDSMLVNLKQHLLAN